MVLRMRGWWVAAVALVSCVPDVHVVDPPEAIRSHRLDAGTVTRGGQRVAHFSLASEHDWTLEDVAATGTPVRFMPWLETVGPPFVVLAPESRQVGLEPVVFEVLLRPGEVDHIERWESQLTLTFRNAQREATALDLTLMGKGVPFTCGLPDLQLGRVAVGESISTTLVVENPDDVVFDLSIGAGMSDSSFTWSPRAANLGPGERVEVAFTFSPSTAGDAGVTLGVRRSEVCGEEHLRVRGVGLAPVTGPDSVVVARPAMLGGSTRVAVPLENWLTRPVTLTGCTSRDRYAQSRDLFTALGGEFPAARRASEGLVPGRFELPLTFAWLRAFENPFRLTCSLSPPLEPLELSVTVE